MTWWNVLPCASVLLLAGLFGVALAILLLRPLRRHLQERQERKRDVNQCRRCGYDLRGQKLPRCPECGTLRGFEVPLDEIGLTEDEIQGSFERKRQNETPENLGNHSD